MTELIRRLDKNRFRVHAACFRRTGAWLGRVEAAADEVAEFPLRSFKSPQSFVPLMRFARWLRARRIVVVHACDLYANVFALPGAALARVPIRIGSRREIAPPDKTAAHLTAQRLAYRLAHRVVANSTAGAERLAAEGVARARITVIPNGIDLTGFIAPSPRERRRVVATVANLRQEKGHDVLLRAAVRVLRQVPDARFRIIGDGPMRNTLVNLAESLGIAHAVDFLGHREDVPALLGESDIFAFPSRTEAFPNGLIEAMAAGLPSIASATGGMLELIEHDHNGLLVPVGEDEALARSILELMGDGGKAARIAHAARQTIESRYSFTKMVGAFEQLYLSQIAMSRIGAAAPHTPQWRLDPVNAGIERRGKD